MKKTPIIITVIFVLLAAAGVLALILTGGGDAPGTADKNGEIDLTRVQNLSVDTAGALHRSGIESVYYSISDETGEVSFYKLGAEGFTPLEATGKRNITAVVSGQKINFDVSYVTVGGKTEGYGLFLNSGDTGVMFYDYFFIKMRELPASHLIDSGDMLILMDENRDDFSNDEKVYEQSFYYNMQSEKVTRFMNEATDSTDMEGKKRSDFAMLTDKLLDTAKDTVPFFTSRYYSVTDENKGVDINLKNRSVYTRRVTNVDYMYAETLDSGTLFLRETEGGFKSIISDGETETAVAEFSGVYNKDYIRSGRFILNLTNGEMTNLATGEKRTMENPGIAEIKYFSVSSDGSKAVLAGAPADLENGTQMTVFYDFTEKLVRYAYGSGLYTSANAGFYFGGDNIVFSRPSSAEGCVYTMMSIKWQDIFTAETVTESAAE